jgi:zinc D-Ala-D-Ala carboxypeptidase
LRWPRFRRRDCRLAGAADLVRSDSLTKALASLGIAPERIAARGLPLHTEPDELVVVQTDADGREHQLTPGAASAWHAMSEAACADGVTIEIASAFRSVERQTELIRRKLTAGVPLDEILAVTTPPGYSEHHTGRAVDVTTPGMRALETEFEKTAAFAWLARNAEAYGWSMSYPRDNAFGFVYEPWHWRYRGD